MRGTSAMLHRRVNEGRDTTARSVSYRVDVVDPPPAEAFEPTPDATHGEHRPRRRLQIALTLTVVVALVLGTIGGSGLITGSAPIVGNEVVEGAPSTEPRVVAVDAAGGVITMDQHGGSGVAYPVPGVAFEFPAWSPDGTSFAAIGRDAEGAGLYVFEARTPSQPQTEAVIAYESADHPPFYLYWTPDSQQVTFLTSESDGLALRVAPADGSATAITLRAGAPMYWDFVDPGRLLVHSGANGPDGFFGEVGVDGALFEEPSAAQGLYRAPAISGDDRLRAYVADDGGTTSEVVVEARDGSGSTRVRVFGPAAFSFNPQSDELAFVAANESSGRNLQLPVGPLRLVDPTTRGVRTLLGGKVVAFFWSPTGKSIAAIRLDQGDDNVTEASRGAGAVLARARANSNVEGAAASLTMHLSFVEVTTGSVVSERLVRLADLFLNQVLPYFDQYALSHRVWSPDGTAIVLPIVGEGDVTRLLAIPVDGSDARALATAEMGFWSP